MQRLLEYARARVAGPCALDRVPERYFFETDSQSLATLSSVSAVTLSLPGPQPIASRAPSRAEIVSLPVPPAAASLPGPGLIRSLPAAPLSESLPLAPFTVSLP